jgi:tRNA(His) 5'-end guanylyltransferase
MKDYEQAEAGRKIMPRLPVIARLDGRNFSAFTQSLKRPYDERLTNLMREVMSNLVSETDACCGYTQSDEITLVFDDEKPAFFEGKIAKMNSVLAAMTSVRFNRLLPEFLPEKADREPLFDCRTWAVPNRQEAVNAVLWREFDATRNSVQMAARSVYSHKQCHKKNNKDLQEMLFQKGINWNDYPAFFKRGSYAMRRRILKTLTPAELAKIPERHRPDGPVERNVVLYVELPPLNKVINRVEVIFDGAEPEVAEMVGA